MRQSGYSEQQKAQKDLDDLLGKTAPSSDLDNLFASGRANFPSKPNQYSNNYQTKTEDILASSPRWANNEDNKEDVRKKTYKLNSPGPSEPMLKNPAQKFEVVDSSDEELVQDTKESINLAGRALEAIPSSVAARAKGIRILTLTNNQMKRWTLLSNFTSLETLVLDKNNLKSLEGMPPMKTLKTLWLNNNQIDDFELILQEVQSLFPNLEYLSMLRNPINPAIYFGSENEKPYYRFRRRILQEMPNLRVIDTQDVTAKEREDAMSHPKFLVARPLLEDVEDTTEDELSRKLSYYNEKSEPAAFIGRGRIKYDGRESEGNRFITNLDL